MTRARTALRLCIFAEYLEQGMKINCAWRTLRDGDAEMDSSFDHGLRRNWRYRTTSVPLLSRRGHFLFIRRNSVSRSVPGKVRVSIGACIIHAACERKR